MSIQTLALNYVRALDAYNVAKNEEIVARNKLSQDFFKKPIKLAGITIVFNEIMRENVLLAYTNNTDKACAEFYEALRELESYEH
jgi:hypothetical protein